MKHGDVGQHQHTFEFNLKALSDAAGLLLLCCWAIGLVD